MAEKLAFKKCLDYSRTVQYDEVSVRDRAQAVQRARSYFTGYAPSSPQIALMKDGQVVYMLERHQIEGRTADDIAKDLTRAFDKYCEKTAAA